MKHSKKAPTMILSPLVACTFRIMKSYTVSDIKSTKPKM